MAPTSSLKVKVKVTSASAVPAPPSMFSVGAVVGAGGDASPPPQAARVKVTAIAARNAGNLNARRGISVSFSSNERVGALL